MSLNKIIILIIAHNDSLNGNEQKSLRQCSSIFAGYPITLICPQGLDANCYRETMPGVKIDFIDPKWQKNYYNFNRLKIESYLYKRYSHYEYILFYEPDAWVFRDELDNWIKQGYDNIGGPWLSLKTNKFEINSGNGGFCLRNVQSALKTLETNKILFLPYLVWLMAKDLQLKYFWKYKWMFLRLLWPVFQNSRKFIKRFPFYEDKFWAKIAPVINKDFKVCTAKEAIPFAFDAHPEILYQMNGQQLPMGAHGWYRKERRDFWAKHIEI